MDGIIPLAVKRVAGDVEVGRFLIGDDDAIWIDVFNQFATDGKASPDPLLPPPSAAMVSRLVHG